MNAEVTSTDIITHDKKVKITKNLQFFRCQLVCLREVLSIIAAILDFSCILFIEAFFVAEIQRRIVLKFQIFQIISFEDIIVQCWSGHNWNFATTAGHNGPVAFRP